jgi:hypothetical protein
MEKLLNVQLSHKHIPWVLLCNREGIPYANVSRISIAHQRLYGKIYLGCPYDLLAALPTMHEKKGGTENFRHMIHDCLSMNSPLSTMMTVTEVKE